MMAASSDKGVFDRNHVIILACVSVFIITILSIMISFIGFLFFISITSLIFYISSNLVQKPKPIGNLFRSYSPPKTNWCSRIEYDHILIPADVDEALDKLYERIIAEHVKVWYNELSLDEEVIQEIRQIFKDLTSDALLRLSRVDITELLMKDVIPVAVQHLDTYLWAIHHSSNNTKLCLENQDQLYSCWLAFMGVSVHPALANRETENLYLENVARKLVPLVIKSSHGQSKVSSSFSISLLANILIQPGLELISQPRIINKLLSLWFSPEPVTVFPSCPEPPVRLLVRFIHSHSQPKPSCLHVDLSAILKNTELLYPFLQYLKENGGVNLLQFILEVEEFNKKMMVVDLNDEDLKSLHSNAKELYNKYIKPGAVNFIRFDDDIIKDISSIINMGYSEIQRIRTTPPLFRAYEQVYNNLEDNLCPQFHTSDEYLKLVMGPRLFDCRPDVKIKDDENQTRRRESWLFSLTLPFKRLNMSFDQQERSVFYCSTEDLKPVSSSLDIIHEQTSLSALKKSISASNLIEKDSGIGSSSKEISRSLDYLDFQVRDKDSIDGRRKSNTLPNFPSHQTQALKKLSLSTAFGSKKINLGRKLSSIITVPSERFATAKQLKGKLTKLRDDVLGSGTLDGSPEPDPETAYDMTDAGDDDIIRDVDCRDLSAWRVTVPRIEPRNDPNTGKSCFVFIVQVQRIDVTSSKNGEDLEWTVERQFHEFYSLQSSLVQFHGIFEDAKLPPRSKLFGGRGLDVLQSKLEPFQEFLVKLLLKPNLKKSDLLFTFLTSKVEFNEASSHKLFKNVPSIKLTKERGQFLQSFLTLYRGSTQNPPPKPGKLGFDAVDSGSELTHVYTDMVACHVSNLGPSQHHNVSSLYDIILYLAARLCNIPEYMLQLITSLRWLLVDSVNHLVHYLIASKLDTVLTSGRVAHLIGIIEESLFDKSSSKMSEEELRSEANNTLDAFQNYLPRLLRDIIGEDEMKKSTKLLFEALQHPLLNKHLAFTLVEILLVKLFPELTL